MHEHDKETWIDLIENYKKFALLWDPTHKDYSDQNLRQKAYEKLLKLYKNIDSEATCLHVKKKLNNMKTTYNREKKKMNSCQEKGIKYTPNLWYFSHFSFLDKNVVKTQERQKYFHFNRYDNKIYLEMSPLKRKRVDANGSCTPKSEADVTEYYLNIEPIHSSEEDNTQNTEPSLPSHLHIQVQSPRIQNIFTSQENTIYNQSLHSLPEHKNKISPDERLRDLLEKQENFVGTVSKMLTKEQDDWEVIGKALGLQLSRLSGRQKTIARKLINDIIYFGMRNELAVESYVDVNEVMEDKDVVYVDLDLS
ncbi:uncharacterized protein LOC125238420 [Leguminivora glycinivorella]|uniref:uncharacterized protein LOC125238420 n=1 Tax=Leguminivora glycinivorella TaxID=1035111 RepID=UPI00200ED188|nr:uncharacterized protein LOC125238420 [Leguminivora glycinivorella]